MKVSLHIKTVLLNKVQTPVFKKIGSYSDKKRNGFFYNETCVQYSSGAEILIRSRHVCRVREHRRARTQKFTNSEAEDSRRYENFGRK